MVASSHKARSRNLLFSSHPPKKQPAQLSYLLLVKPINKLLPGWSKEGAKEEGREIPAGPAPPQPPPGAMVCSHLPPRLSGKAVDEAHTPAGWKYLQKEHGEGCIITSPRCSSVPTDLILGTKLKRARCQR